MAAVWAVADMVAVENEEVVDTVVVVAADMAAVEAVADMVVDMAAEEVVVEDMAAVKWEVVDDIKLS